MLTLEEDHNRAVAKAQNISKQFEKNQIIYVKDECDEEDISIEEIIDNIPKNLRVCPFCRRFSRNYSEMINHLRGCKKLRKMRQNNSKILSSKIFNISSNKITTKNGVKLFSVPNIKTRDVICIVGSSGSGKSTWTAKYIRYWKTLFPDKKVYLVTEIPNDDAFSDLYEEKLLERLVITESDIDNLINLEELYDSLVVFDDFKSKNKELLNYVTNLLNDILVHGRSHSSDEGIGIYCIVTLHQLFDYKITKDILQENNLFVFFPKSGGLAKIKKYLRDHVGIETKKMNYLLNLRSRWVAISQTYPRFALYEGGIELI